MKKKGQKNSGSCDGFTYTLLDVRDDAAESYVLLFDALGHELVFVQPDGRWQEFGFDTCALQVRAEGAHVFGNFPAEEFFGGPDFLYICHVIAWRRLNFHNSIDSVLCLF